MPTRWRTWVACWLANGLPLGEAFWSPHVPMVNEAERRVWTLHSARGNTERRAQKADKPLIAILGNPGTGQTTFADLVAKEYDMRETSITEDGTLNELRERIFKGQGEISLEEALLELMVARVKTRMAEVGPEGLVIDGWPRGPTSLRKLEEAGCKITGCVFLEVGGDDDEEEFEERQTELEEGLDLLRAALGPKGVVVRNDRDVVEVGEDVKKAVGELIGLNGGNGQQAIGNVQGRGKEKGAGRKVKGESEGEGAELKFGGLVLTGSVARRMRRDGMLDATAVQEAAIPRIRRGDNVLVHAETGSGKTLAYLLPVLQDMDVSVPRQVLVVTPTRELAVQVAGEVAKLCGDRVDQVALYVEETEVETLSGVTAPVVVGPAKLLWSEVVKTNATSATALPQALGYLKHLIIDEVDRCISPLGQYATEKEKRQRARHPRPAALLLNDLYVRLGIRPQVIGASATIGRPLKRELARLMGLDPKFEGPVVVRPVAHDESDAGADSQSNGGGPRAVSVPPNIEHRYIACPDDDLQHKLMGVRSYILEKSPRSPIVFIQPDVSVQEVCVRLGRLLRPLGRTVVPLHEALGFTSKPVGGKSNGTKGVEPTGEGQSRKRGPSQYLLSRQRQMTERLSRATTGSSDAAYDRATDAGAVHASEAAPPVLVTSVDTARGLDFGGNVDCVLIMGKVRGPDEYQHVAGRTGRQGRAGKAVSIISYADVKKLASWEAVLGVRFQREQVFLGAAGKGTSAAPAATSAKGSSTPRQRPVRPRDPSGGGVGEYRQQDRSRRRPEDTK